MSGFADLIPHATEFERKLADHAAQKYTDIDPEIIRAIHDPWQCPAKWLPWLAYHWSVDVWNDAWPEQTKRQACANALPGHKNKGTHGGLLDALAVLGVTAEIKYWHEMTPPGEPGTMSITLNLNEQGSDMVSVDAGIILGPQTIRDLIAQIDRNKRLSMHYIFVLQMHAGATGIATAQTARLVTHERIDSHAGTAIKAGQAGVGQAQTARLVTHERIDSRAGTAIKAGQAGVGQAQTARLVTHERIDSHADTHIQVNALLMRAASGTAAKMIIHMRLG